MMSDFVILASQKFPTKIAITPEEHSEGLMYEPWPPPIMAFPSKTASIKKFWMKNTPSDLDIIFAFNKKIVGIVRGAAFSEDHIGPNCMTDLVVEVPAGFVENKKIKVGDSIDLVYGIKSLARLLSYEKEAYG